jgi:valyl-tRNA synthetase
LPLKQVIGFDGKMNHFAGKFEGMYVNQARKAIVEEMQAKGLIEKIDENYKNRVGLCYKCKHILEPLPLEQWFIKVKPLVQKAIDAVKKGEIKFTSKNFEKQYYIWLENLRDWNISRQIVWGIQIPAWKNVKTGKWIVTEGEAPEGKDWVQDKDTLDTWFSSSQWPFATLMANCKCNGSGGFFDKFYPTEVMETGYDLLKAWVSRMIMMGIYRTGKVPFKNVLFHGLVNDPYGKKMSKSKGNVVNPLELVDQYGADAVRFALIYGNATGNDQALSYPKLDASRKFTNKLWNMGRFIEMKKSAKSGPEILNLEKLLKVALDKKDKEIILKTINLTGEVTKNIDSYNFNYAAETLYEFAWHEFADKYIEDVKNRLTPQSYQILNSIYLVLLKLLHPFMPFVTEEIYQRFGFGKSIMIDKWPQYEV